MSQHVQPTGRYRGQVAQAVLGRYRARTPTSAALHGRGRKVLPGGTSGNLRYFQPYPLYFASGTGARMTDVDGHSYIDCFLCNGPLLLGHQHAAVVRFVHEHSGMGALIVNPPLAIDLAEEIQQLVPCAERIRFVNSGTEAVLSAVRLARAATGRHRIVKFFGHYHGQDDQFLVGLDATQACFGSGIPAESVANTVLLPYGDIAALERTLQTEGGIAAVLLDPAMHAGGLWGSRPEYLQAVRALTSARGVALIFDEVITGFRLGARGAQGHYGVTPDLATYAKALASGEKLGAVVGKARFMAGLDPERAADVAAVFQSGTGNDGTGGLAAGLASVRAYRALEREGAYAALDARAARLAEGLRQAFQARGVPFHANQLGPMLQLFLTDAEPRFESFTRLPSGPLELFYLALISEGVLLSLPSSNHIYLSFAHTDADITRVLDAAAAVLDRHDFGELVRSANALH